MWIYTAMVRFFESLDTMARTVYYNMAVIGSVLLQWQCWARYHDIISYHGDVVGLGLVSIRKCNDVRASTLWLNKEENRIRARVRARAVKEERSNVLAGVAVGLYTSVTRFD